MPNQQKKVIFCTAGVLSFLCALGVVTALGTPLWIKATFLCKTGALLVNASGQELDKFMGEMQYGLFHGEGVRQCGLGARPFRFSCDLLVTILITYTSPITLPNLGRAAKVFDIPSSDNSACLFSFPWCVACAEAGMVGLGGKPMGFTFKD
ncbi:Clarin-1 [Pteropus alecto]|uniref:Clarin-1 n=1 Tax=Pteropus alecto TaxID=9402 RepID=L5JNP8_PTEAL|nr:Clarin-1 [Pteropus alecto]